MSPGGSEDITAQIMQLMEAGIDGCGVDQVAWNDPYGGDEVQSIGNDEL